MNVNDFLNSSGEEGNSDMDISLNCDDTELMSSEFFDSVLSLGNNMEAQFFTTLEEDIHLSSDTSSNLDEVLSPQSYYSESDKTSMESNDENGTILGNLDGFDELISMLEPIPEYQVKDPPLAVPNTPPTQKLPSKIVIQNPNNKKFISKPMVNPNQVKKHVKSKPQILKVQQISNNGSPVLLPLNIKSIKILNSPEEVAAFTGNFRKRKIEPKSDDETNLISNSANQYPPLILSNEEKRLLAKDGITLPTHHPLTKNDERELKRIRRKIRNKISAQDSRKRKKEYVDSLEERVRRGSEENKNLLQRVKALQRQNKTLIAHVHKLQALICNSTSKATPSTCLMVVLLSALLVSLPNMKLFENKHSQMSSDQEQGAVRRSLLSSHQNSEDNLNMEEFLVFKDEDDFESKMEELDMDNSTEQEITKVLEDLGKKYNDVNYMEKSKSFDVLNKMMDTLKGFLSVGNNKGLFGGGTGYDEFAKKGFIEPDIDEYEPPEEPYTKRFKIELNSLPINENIVTTTVNTNKLTLNTKDK